MKKTLYIMLMMAFVLSINTAANANATQESMIKNEMKISAEKAITMILSGREDQLDSLDEYADIKSYIDCNSATIGKIDAFDKNKIPVSTFSGVVNGVNKGISLYEDGSMLVFSFDLNNISVLDEENTTSKSRVPYQFYYDTGCWYQNYMGNQTVSAQGDAYMGSVHVERACLQISVTNSPNYLTIGSVGYLGTTTMISSRVIVPNSYWLYTGSNGTSFPNQILEYDVNVMSGSTILTTGTSQFNVQFNKINSLEYSAVGSISWWS